MAKLRIDAYMLSDILNLPGCTTISPEIIELEVKDPSIDSSVIEVQAIFGQDDYQGTSYFMRYEPVKYYLAGREVDAIDVDKFLKGLKKK